MNSTSLRSFSCSDWILSFVVFVSSCRFHHQQKPKKKDLVSRSLLSLPFALLLLLVVCFRACLCAFAHHQKKKPSQKKKKVENRKPRKKVHFCVLVTFLVLAVCSCYSCPCPRYAFFLLLSSCVLVLHSCPVFSLLSSFAVRVLHFCLVIDFFMLRSMFGS